MAASRAKIKGRRHQESFVAIPHIILESEEYAALSYVAVKLLFDLFAQYRGGNNGDFTAAWSVLKRRGWKSKATIFRALGTLLDNGWIEMTRQGGRHKCSLYAVTWKPIDECGKKLDVCPTRVASNLWKKKIENAALNVGRIGIKTVLVRPPGATN